MLKLRIHFFPRMPVTTRITLQFIEGNPELNLLFATVSNTGCVVYPICAIWPIFSWPFSEWINARLCWTSAPYSWNRHAHPTEQSQERAVPSRLDANGCSSSHHHGSEKGALPIVLAFQIRPFSTSMIMREKSSNMDSKQTVKLGLGQETHQRTGLQKNNNP